MLDSSLRKLGRRLRALRGEKATQSEVAERAQIDPKHYQAIEGGRHNITFATLLALSKALNVTLAELLEGV